MSLEQLQTAIVTQGASLPDLRIDLEDSDGNLTDLTGYGSFAAKVIDADGTAVVSGVTCTGTTTGFAVSFTDAHTELAAGEYLVQAQCSLGGRTRMGKCRLQVVTGY
jgi:hypothetical protein